MGSVGRSESELADKVILYAVQRDFVDGHMRERCVHAVYVTTDLSDLITMRNTQSTGEAEYLEDYVGKKKAQELWLDPSKILTVYITELPDKSRGSLREHHRTIIPTAFRFSERDCRTALDDECWQQACAIADERNEPLAYRNEKAVAYLLLIRCKVPEQDRLSIDYECLPLSEAEEELRDSEDGQTT